MPRENRPLILPAGHAVDDVIEVGTLTRREADQVVVAYSFNLRTNAIATTNVRNPNARRAHVFKAYRIPGDPPDAVTLRSSNQILAGLGAAGRGAGRRCGLKPDRVSMHTASCDEPQEDG